MKLSNEERINEIELQPKINGMVYWTVDMIKEHVEPYHDSIKDKESIIKQLRFRNIQILIKKLELNSDFTEEK